MRRVLLLFSFATLALGSLTFAADSRPRIRAVTAFIEIDRNNYAAKIEETQKFLAVAKEALNRAGFEGAGGRITTQPFPVYTKGLQHEEAMDLIRKLRESASKGRTGLNIGAAMLNDNDDTAPVALLADILASVSVNANLIVADDRGIHWHAVGAAAKLIKEVSQRSPHGDGNFNFGAIAMMKPYGPYYPGSYHLGKGHAFALAMEGANVVADVFARYHDPREAEEHLSEAFTKYTKEAETVAMQVAASTGWTYEGIDATPAPLKDLSIGGAIESFIGGPFGSSGTLTASGIITRAVQSTPVKRTGYSGLMIPVMEDNLLARRWAEGTFNLDSILAYSAVCAGGADTVPLPGDVSEEQIARILGDVAWLAYKWNKPLAARLLPAPGKQAGQQTEFSGAALTNTMVQPLVGSKR
ncbi:MAG TPA: DUF711 family protein [Bryobacteraceae bacterium]|nr:DUF711 family protein [Bryobacteraceae bacterium]